MNYIWVFLVIWAGNTENQLGYLCNLTQNMRNISCMNIDAICNLCFVSEYNPKCIYLKISNYSCFWTNGSIAVSYLPKIHWLSKRQWENRAIQQETNELLIGVCYMCSFMWGRPVWTQWLDFVPELAWLVWWRWGLQLENSCRWGKAYPAGCAAVGSFSHHTLTLIHIHV